MSRAPDTDAATLALSREPYGTPARLRARIALHELADPGGEDFHHWLWRLVEAPADARVLEVGAGDARMWRAIAGRVPPAWRLTLSDRSPGMLEAARETLAAAGHAEAAGAADPSSRDGQSGHAEATGLAADFVLADAADLPFADASFDLAFANHMLYHLPDPARAVAELRRVLRPGGRLVAATNGEHHLAEIAALLDELTEAWPGVRVDRPQRLTFTLENGEAILRVAFTEVARHDRDDVLRVADAEVLARYLLSLAYARDADEAASLATWAQVLVAGRLRAGPLPVRRVSGVFVAR